LEGVPDAVRRGRKLKCKECASKGATLGCHVRNCRSSFHLPCARLNHCVLQVRFCHACLSAVCESAECMLLCALCIHSFIHSFICSADMCLPLGSGIYAPESLHVRPCFDTQRTATLCVGVHHCSLVRCQKYVTDFVQMHLQNLQSARSCMSGVWLS